MKYLLKDFLFPRMFNLRRALLRVAESAVVAEADRAFV